MGLGVAVENGVVNCGRGGSVRAAGEQAALYGGSSGDIFVCIPPTAGIESRNMQGQYEDRGGRRSAVNARSPARVSGSTDWLRLRLILC